MTKREMMVKAHKMARKMVGNYSARLSLALRELWASIKKGVKKVVEKITKESLAGKAQEWIEKRVMWSGKCTVKTSDWTKNGNDRTYVTIRNYTNAGNLKHELKCGYLDNATGKYVVGKYDHIDLVNMIEL